MLLLINGRLAHPGRCYGRCHGGIAMERRVDHVVTRPGRRHGDPDVQIPVAEDLTTVPGIPLRETDLSFYSRTYPQETQNIEKAADRQWVWTVYSPEMSEYRKDHNDISEPLIDAAAVSGDLEPTGTPTGEDVTEAIRRRRVSWALAKWVSPSMTGATRTPAKGTGRNTSTPSAWHWSRTTCRRSPSPAWTPSAPTSGPMRSKAPCYSTSPTISGRSGITPRCIAPMTTAPRTFPCSWLPVWGNWAPTVSCSRRILAPEPDWRSSPPTRR